MIAATAVSCGGGSQADKQGGSGAGGHSSSNASGNGSGSSSTGGLFLDGGQDNGSCVPSASCSSVGATCGVINDGCGRLLTCGDCPTGQSCGGGGIPNVCGTPTCTPKACKDLGYNCGPAGDGCGGTLQCGNCTNGQTCGGGGTASVCGAPACQAKTCKDLGASCGYLADSCGGLLDCGSCSLPQTCGGGGNSGICAPPSSCTNLCLKQVTCADPSVTTTISGTVYAPNGADPLMNALVYIPNGTVQAFSDHITCDNCSAQTSGDPLVSTVTGIDGKFTLRNVPVGQAFEVVIQLGRWRRRVPVTSVTACTDNPLPASSTRFPRNKSEGDIPKMAFATGAVDALECVLRKIGIDDAEFTAPSANGRVHLYFGNGNDGTQPYGGAIASPDTGRKYTLEDALWSDAATLAKYDVVFFPCQGDQFPRSNVALKNLVDYANAGGRVFTTHFSYVWLYQNPPFDATATWHTGAYSGDSTYTGVINTSFPKGQALAQWLLNQKVSTTYGQIPVSVIRQDLDAVASSSELWMTTTVTPGGKSRTFPLHYEFNAPVNASSDQQCGRVLFDDFHVEDAQSNWTTLKVFPAECSSAPMTPQEKLLEFMIFDLSSCVSSNKPTCVPKTCGDLGMKCGAAGDGCGGKLDCGTCAAGEVCSGLPSVCSKASCTPKSCADQGIECGPAGDGCGNELLCGSCANGQTCGGGGKSGVCGSGGGSCVPKTCGQLGIQCGPAGDGCGNPLKCGDCTSGTCGGGGTASVCGSTCKAKTCAQVGAECGPIADGCGGVLQCGDCVAPNTCGGGGVPSKCGGSAGPF